MEDFVSLRNYLSGISGGGLFSKPKIKCALVSATELLSLPTMAIRLDTSRNCTHANYHDWTSRYWNALKCGFYPKHPCSCTYSSRAKADDKADPDKRHFQSRQQLFEQCSQAQGKQYLHMSFTRLEMWAITVLHSIFFFFLFPMALNLLSICFQNRIWGWCFDQGYVTISFLNLTVCCFLSTCFSNIWWWSLRVQSFCDAYILLHNFWWISKPMPVCSGWISHCA